MIKKSQYKKTASLTKISTYLTICPDKIFSVHKQYTCNENQKVLPDLTSNSEDHITLEVYQLGCGGCNTKSYELSKDVRITALNKPYECCEVVGLFFASCLFAFCLHFVPCIAYTCDLGKNDVGAVRGAIWFAGWPLIFILSLIPC